MFYVYKTCLFKKADKPENHIDHVCCSNEKKIKIDAFPKGLNE